MVLVWNPEGRRTLEKPSIRRRIILKSICERFSGWGHRLIDLAQDRYRWWAVVNVVMNLRVP
jgi:hypothetical protein